MLTMHAVVAQTKSLGLILHDPRGFQHPKPSSLLLKYDVVSINKDNEDLITKTASQQGPVKMHSRIQSTGHEAI